MGKIRSRVLPPSPPSSHEAAAEGGSVNIDLGPLRSKISCRPREAAAALSVGLTRFYELVNSGELITYKDGGGRRVLVSSIGDYLRRRIAENAAAHRPAAAAPAAAAEPAL